PPKVFAGIMFTRNTQKLYKIPVIDNLISAIHRGAFPPETTIVLRLVPPVVDAAKKLTDGMRRLESRRIIMQCFEAFK
ncbi:hypothetical protein BU17DRAFT_5836, partial [Hysterangium stoloniferum]